MVRHDSAGPRRIVHVTVVHPRYDTRILLKQCVSLAREGGTSVTLMVADGAGDEEVAGVGIRDIGVPPLGRFGRAVIGSARSWRLLHSAKPDLVHFHDPELLPLAMLTMATGRAVVFDMHENLPKELLTKPWVFAPLRRILSRVARVFQAVACRVIPTVFAETSYAGDFPMARRSVVALNYPLLDSLEDVAAEKGARFAVGYIGAIAAERGALTFLEAAATLRQEGVDVEMLLVGPIRPDVARSTLLEAGVQQGWVTCTGRLQPADGWARIATCHVGVATLHPSPNFVDSIPTKLFEYMALGLPVIASDFPLWRRVVAGAACGLLVNPLDVGHIADALRWMREHPAEAAAMGRRGKATVLAEYSWDSEFAKLSDFYAGILQPTGVSS